MLLRPSEEQGANVGCVSVAAPSVRTFKGVFHALAFIALLLARAGRHRRSRRPVTYKVDRSTPIRASRPITSAACRCGAASSTRTAGTIVSTRKRRPAPSTSRIDTASDRHRHSRSSTTHLKAAGILRRREDSHRHLQGQARQVQGRRAHGSAGRAHAARRHQAGDAHHPLVQVHAAPDEEERVLRRGRGRLPSIAKTSASAGARRSASRWT